MKITKMIYYYLIIKIFIWKTIKRKYIKERMKIMIKIKGQLIYKSLSQKIQAVYEAGHRKAQQMLSQIRHFVAAAQPQTSG